MRINLLPQSTPSLSERFFSFLLTYGRFIIIGTEVIVLTAFVLRFKLDRDFIDLHDRIKQQEAIVRSLASVEQRSRKLQERLSYIASLNQKGEGGKEILRDIPSFVPTNVVFETLSIQDKKLTIGAKTLSGEGLSSFVRRMRGNTRFSDIALDNVTRDESIGGQIRFTVSASFKYDNRNE